MQPLITSSTRLLVQHCTTITPLSVRPVKTDLRVWIGMEGVIMPWGNWKWCHNRLSSEPMHGSTHDGEVLIVRIPAMLPTTESQHLVLYWNVNTLKSVHCAPELPDSIYKGLPQVPHISPHPPKVSFVAFSFMVEACIMIDYLKTFSLRMLVVYRI